MTMMMGISTLLLRLTKATDMDNVGVALNLCHHC